MFEKEAEDWIKNNLHSKEEDYIKAFKDGAEFGYKKAKEEDKWHYVEDGDLPKDHIPILISNIYGHSETGYYFNGEWFGREVIFNDVYAWCELPLPSEKMKQKWKEIVPPKESE